MDFTADSIPAFIIFFFYITIISQELLYCVIPRFIFSFNSFGGIFFAVTTTPNSSRQAVIDMAWGHALNTNPKYEVAFISNKGKEIPGYTYIHPPEDLLQVIAANPKNIKQRDILAKKYLGAKYFIEQTDKEWYWVVGDDVGIDIDNLDYLLEQMGKKYNTNNDYVKIGHCIGTAGRAFIQGGSGFILSRKAAKVLVDIGVKLVQENNIPEDIKLIDFRKALNLTVQDTASPFMYGHAGYLRDMSLNLEDYPICPKQGHAPYSFCYGRQLFDLKELTGIHHSNATEVYDAIKRLIEVKKKGLNLKYYYSINGLHFCGVREENISKTEKKVL